MIRTIDDIEARTVPEPNTGCWLWAGARDKDGYGRYRISRAKYERAHRGAYRMVHGCADGVVMHSCDTPSCVNPDHLRLGSQNENVRDMDRKGRRVRIRGERQGNAKLTEEAVRSIRAQRLNGEPLSRIASAHGVSMVTAWRAASGVYWKHVD